MKIPQCIKRFFREELAVTTTEYAVMLACIVLIAFKSMQLCGFQVGSLYQDIADLFGGSVSN